MAFDRMNIESFTRHVDGLRVSRDISCIFCHHTAGLRKHWNGRQSVIAIDNYHRDVRGWKYGIGYNYLVDCNTPGVIWAGRSLQEHTGAHTLIDPCASYLGPRWSKYARSYPNIHGIGVCMPGSYDKDNINLSCYETMVQVVAILSDKFGIADTHIGYHEEVANKCCPGSKYNFPKLSSFVEAVQRYKKQDFATAYFQMNDDAPVRAIIIDSTAFIFHEDAEVIAEKYNLSIPDHAGRGLAVRAFLQHNALPEPGFDASRKLITGHTPDHWTNVKLVINDVLAGRVWMVDGQGVGRVEDIARYSGWPESMLPVSGDYVPLRVLANEQKSHVVLSTEYWETHRKVYLYMDGEDFSTTEAVGEHEITPDPYQHT